MANGRHIELIAKGVDEWNRWRTIEKDTIPNFTGTNLTGIQFSSAELSKANFSGSDLTAVDLRDANLSNTDFSRAKLHYCDFSRANLKGANFQTAKLLSANLSEANLQSAIFTGANLSGANLSNANLMGADFSTVKLAGADFSNADLYNVKFVGVDFQGTIFTNSILGVTSFDKSDLSQAIGLETVQHFSPSSVGIDTLYLSRGKIPDSFLRGCGIPEDFIHYIPSLLSAERAIQFYSCFISYATDDEEFAKRLHSRMRDAKLRVWFAPEDMKGGKKIFEQIESAIQMHDRLLLVLSEESMKSEWVTTEVKHALENEKKENRRKLFPIRLTDYEKLRQWKLKDADTGKDLAVEIRSYFIPDFSNWKDHDAFESAFERLLRDLKAEEEKKHNPNINSSTEVNPKH